MWNWKVHAARHVSWFSFLQVKRACCSRYSEYLLISTQHSHWTLSTPPLHNLQQKIKHIHNLFSFLLLKTFLMSFMVDKMVHMRLLTVASTSMCHHFYVSRCSHEGGMSIGCIKLWPTRTSAIVRKHDIVRFWHFLSAKAQVLRTKHAPFATRIFSSREQQGATLCSPGSPGALYCDYAHADRPLARGRGF